MATRSRIGIRNSDDSVDSIYCHWGGYPSHNGRLLITHYTDEKKIRELMALGDISSLGLEIGEQQDFDKPTNKDWCVAYGRDRGEEDCEAEHSSTVHEYLGIRCWAEYYYIFHYGRWMVQATYGEDEGRWVLVEDALRKDEQAA
jgi:hypothetical protein